jgi:denticleless
LGRPRDFAPALSVAFSSVAKAYNAAEACGSGRRRLIAVAGEEGGVRIVDVDEGLGNHREEKGWWWRAHSNAVFDVKWTADDSQIVGKAMRRVKTLLNP